MSEKSNYYWYKATKGNVHDELFPYLAKLENRQSYRQTENVKFMRMYGNMEFQGASAHNFIKPESGTSVQNRVTLNVVQSMIDTVTAKITKNKPRPQFLTDGGNFQQQRKSEKLTQFSEGQFYITDLYTKATMAFKDSCIFGTGALKIFAENGKIKVERVFIDELKVDDTESYYGEPRQMHQTKWIHKEVLKTMFPAKSGAIDSAASMTQLVTKSYTMKTQDGDMVLVAESWHLPSGEKATDGRHTMTISNTTLMDESYNKDYFPFVFFRWNTRPLGFFGQGIAEQLTGLQVEINKLLRTIQVSMHLVSVPKLFVDAGSKIVSAHLDNKIGSIIRFNGTLPTPGQLGVVPAELFTQVDRLYQRSFEIIGVSQLSAQSTKPQGLNSGKALRTYNDIESERFMDVGNRYQDSFIEATRIMIDLTKGIAEETGNFTVKTPGSGFLKTINWTDVQIDEDDYIMRCFPTSKLSNDPAGRLAEVQELLGAGFISKEDGMDLLDFPDLRAFNNMANAGVEDIKRQIEIMVDSGEYQTPEPYQNLQYGIKKMQQAYLHYKTMDTPEEILELFRRWIEDANDLLAQASQGAMNMQAAAQAQANPQLAAPAAPEISGMLPVAGAGTPIV